MDAWHRPEHLTRGPGMTTNKHEDTNGQSENHDFELSEMQRKVVAVAIETRAGNYSCQVWVDR